MWLCGSSKLAAGLPLELVEGKTYIIGRDEECDVCVRDLSVSRQHACLRVRNGKIELEDLNSSNGTKKNDEPIERCNAEVDDKIIFGLIAFEIKNSPLAKVDSVEESATTARMKREDILDRVVEQLSPAQQKVLKHALKGWEEQKIAVECNLSQHTIHNHIQAIYRSFNVHKRQELLSLFLRGNQFPDNES